jgi:hypothetical protein
MLRFSLDVQLEYVTISQGVYMTALQKGIKAIAEIYKKKGMLKPMLENARRLQAEVIAETRRVREATIAK